MTQVVSAGTALLSRRPVLSLKSAACHPTALHLVGHTARAAAEPAAQTGAPRAMCFVDGQNLHRSAQHAFGIERNVRPFELARAVCKQQGWLCTEVNYYQGSPDPQREPFESRLWLRRRARLTASGVRVFDRRFQYLELEQQL